jgi:hypothetical protein
VVKMRKVHVEEMSQLPFEDGVNATGPKSTEP